LPFESALECAGTGTSSLMPGGYGRGGKANDHVIQFRI
jgi:hypothetical protein